MNRRGFIGALLAAAPVAQHALAGPRPSTADAPLVRPPLLSKGDKVGVIAPSTPISDPEDYARIEPVVRSLGLEPVIAPHVHRRSLEFKASIAERVGDLHDLFADPSIKAVFSARGGYGASEILPYIDYGLIRRNPKLFIGYSDATALHCAFRKMAGLMTFHGPMPVSSALTPFTRTWFEKAVFAPGALGALGRPDEPNPLRPAYPLRTLSPGAATAPVVGGNLSILLSLFGTPYEIDTRGTIFFFEDIDEEPYRIGRMLTQLKEAGKLDGAAGVLVGRCKDVGPRDYKPSTVSAYSFADMLDQTLAGLPIPVLYGMPLGHTDDQLTLPLGGAACLDARAQTVTFL